MPRTLCKAGRWTPTPTAAPHFHKGWSDNSTNVPFDGVPLCWGKGRAGQPHPHTPLYSCLGDVYPALFSLSMFPDMLPLTWNKQMSVKDLSLNFELRLHDTMTLNVLNYTMHAFLILLSHETRF